MPCRRSKIGKFRRDFLILDSRGGGSTLFIIGSFYGLAIDREAGERRRNNVGGGVEVSGQGKRAVRKRRGPKEVAGLDDSIGTVRDFQGPVVVSVVAI